MGGSKAYPYGSVATVRGHVLATLGVPKAATRIREGRPGMLLLGRLTGPVFVGYRRESKPVSTLPLIRMTSCGARVDGDQVSKSSRMSDYSVRGVP